MKLSSNSLNIRNSVLYAANKGVDNLRSKSNLPSFKGMEKVADDVVDVGKKKIAPHLREMLSGVLTSIGAKAKKFISNHITTGVSVTYENADEVLGLLRKNFGSTFDECIGQIDKYSKKSASSSSGLIEKALSKSGFGYKIDREKNTITFHKTPFVRNVLSGFKEFTVGIFLDACIWGRDKFRKIALSHNDGMDVLKTAKSKGFNKLLDDRVIKKQAIDSFYRVSGVFEQATEGLQNFAAKNKKMSAAALKSAQTDFVKENVERLAQESVQAANKKVGKYNTKTERAFNRLGTGFVSASFAATDFYNISMLQNDDKDKANISARKRFAQDMRRQGLTAGITYIILGAFQNKVNKSIPYAVLSLGGVTLMSEILSRKMGGISLRPLSPEEAAKIADKRDSKKFEKIKKEAAKKGIKNPNIEQKEKEQSLNSALSFNPSVFNLTNDDNSDNLKVFEMFTKKLDSTIENTNTTFTANNTISNNEIKQETASNKKKKDILSTVLKVLGGIVGASLVIGYMRTKNIFNIDTIIKSISKKYNDGVKKLTTKQLIMPKDDVDGFLGFMKSLGFEKQYEELKAAVGKIEEKGVLSGDSSVVQKNLGSKAVSSIEYYDMGKIDSKGRRALVNFILYPVNTISRIFKNGNNIIKRIFVKEAKSNQTQELSSEVAASFIKQYSDKYKRAIAKGDLDGFRKEMESALTRHFSEANSKNKNTSIAMLSRFLITLISGYFFVNDYRNEVLIESRGKDTERAKATVKERVGHKFANFFLNSMFMDIFNTTFEHVYLSSVLGATAVSMATEVTNETAVRASICTPTKRMNREQLIEYENKRLNDKGPKGTYYRAFMKLTGKKPLSEKASKK